jgi:tetratricopeptide (TPR) repeat protein
LVLVLAVSACVPTYERRLGQHRAAGDLDAASGLLADATERDPQNPDLKREAGILAYEQGQRETAIATLEETLARAPDDRRAEVYLGAAYEQSGRWVEAEMHYRRAEVLSATDPAIAAALACQRNLIASRRLDDLVTARLAAEKEGGDLPGGERLLILPFSSPYGTNPRATKVRLGLAAVASEDWRGSPPAVPFAEVEAFLAALGTTPDPPIDEEMIERLARLTGARYVLAGQLSELHELVSLAPVLIVRGASTPAEGAAPESAGLAAGETRLEYQQQHIGALVELERDLLEHVAQALAVEAPPADEDLARRFSGRSSQAIELLGEAILLERSGEEAAAAERLTQATALDPELTLARDAKLRLTSCRGTVGDPSALIAAYERAESDAEDRDQEREFLAGTTETVGRVGGAAGESEDYSINRSGAAGSAAFPVRLPR